MAELNLDYYTAKDHYSDGDIEETLLKMAQEGKSFEDLPEDWVCPICGVGKELFEAEE